MSDATGASVENLSALEDVAVRTGTTMDNVSGILVKFNNALKEADGKNGASQALKAIGLDAEALKQIDPAEALRQTAVALSKFADDGDKARIVQELFGKSVKDAAPFLKDLAEQGQLNATVTKEQAEEAEKFNKQLFALQKNAVDFGRAIVGSVLPALNSFLENYRELSRLGGFDLILKDAAKGFVGIQSDIVGDVSANIKRLSEERKKLLEATVAPDPDFADAFARQTKDRIGEIERLLAVLNSRQARAQALLSPANDGAKPKIGALPSITPKGPKGPDPDADFKAYLKNLELQIQRTQELSTVEKVLDDIRRGALSVTEPQKAQLIGLAQLVDKEKEFTEQLKLSREAAIESGDAISKRNEQYQATLNRLLSATPSAQLEETRNDIRVLTDEFQRFVDTAGQSGISEEKYLEAVSTRLNLNADALEKNKGLAEELNLSFTSAFEDAVVEGKKLSDVLGGLEKDIIRIVTRKFVTEPLADFLGESLNGLFGGSSGAKKSSSGGGDILSGLFGGGGGFNLSSIPSFLFGDSSGGGFFPSFFSGLGFADGGIPPVGKASIVGEEGPEFFVPNTAGRIIPNDQLGNYNQASNAPVYKQSINVNIAATPGMSRDTALQQGLAYGTGIQRALNRNGV